MSGLLGQAKPAASIWTDIYTVPATTVATARVIIANLGAADTTFRVALSKGGAAIADEHRVTGGDEPIKGDVSGSTIGFAISSGDIIRVFSGNGNLAFTATGEERVE